MKTRLIAVLVPALWAAAALGGCSSAEANLQEAAEARGVEDPMALVEGVYQAYRSSGGGDAAAPEPPVFAYSPRLRALFEAYDAWSATDEEGLGALAFDWWTSGQDWRIEDLALAEEADGPDRRAIVARFRNFGEPVLIRFRFVRQDDRWYLDDAEGGDGLSEGWTLSELLSDRPD